MNAATVIQWVEILWLTASEAQHASEEATVTPKGPNE